MNRFILGIGAFILTFGISTSLVGLLFGFPKYDRAYSHDAKTEKASIMRVLDQDIFYGERRRNDAYRLVSQNSTKGISASDSLKSAEFAEITERYASDISAIDTSDTPADFAYAWNEHMAAWAKQAKYLNSVREPSFSSDSLFDNHDEISATYYQVLRIAKRYGAPMKARYFR